MKFTSPYRQKSVASCIEQQWYQKSTWIHLLRPISWLYQLILYLNIKRYRHRPWKAHVPVITISNLTVGGTGKTPLIMAIYDSLSTLGLRPGILASGYGGSKTSRNQKVLKPSDEPSLWGDEAVMMSQRGYRVSCGKNRAQACKKLLDHDPNIDMVLCDDGLFQSDLYRDHLLLLEQPYANGNGLCLPAGPMRAPKHYALIADRIVYPAKDIIIQPADYCYALHDRKQQISLASLANRSSNITAIAGIAQPWRFFNQLVAQLGHDIHCQAFDDHFDFDADSLNHLKNRCIIMTQKDAIKCQRFEHPDAWVWPIHIRLCTSMQQWLTLLVNNQ